MKALICISVALFSLPSLADFANQCELHTREASLQHPINKKIICNESLYAITGSYQWQAEMHLAVEVVVSPQIYSLKLPRIRLQTSDQVIERSGTLHWNPDGERVVLD